MGDKEFEELYEQLDRMVDLINYGSGTYINEENPYVLYEGLIRTASLDFTIVLLKRWFKMYGMSDRHGVNLRYMSISKTQDDTLNVYILPFINKKEIIKNFLTYINTLGYFISTIVSKKTSDKNFISEKFTEDKLYSFMNQYNDLDYIYVSLEAKFDIEVDSKDFPDKLYHITRQEVIPKIKRRGLSPRTESKISTHPEKIYFGIEYERIINLVNKFKDQAKLRGKNDQKFAVLEIETKSVPHLRLFEDPNYKGYGYYGLVNVPPNAIKIVKENI